MQPTLWQQIYDPFGNMIISTLLGRRGSIHRGARSLGSGGLRRWFSCKYHDICCKNRLASHPDPSATHPREYIRASLGAIPVLVMLVGLGFLHMKAHLAAGAGLLAALAIAIFAYGMPASMAGNAALFGGLTGLLPIGWIVLNIIFLHQLTEQNGSFKILQDSIASITEDRRLQLLLIAFAFGAFFEGAAGFGTPVAVTAAILIGLGFSPLAASGLSLIANTAPVAFGALGTPIITLAKVHNYEVMALSQMVGRQLPFFSLLVPFWLIWAFAGRKAMMEIWPAILVTGATFALSQFLVSNYIGPELVDVIAAIVSMVSLVAFLKVWQPKKSGHRLRCRAGWTTAATTWSLRRPLEPPPRAVPPGAAHNRWRAVSIHAPTSFAPGRRGPS